MDDTLVWMLKAGIHLLKASKAAAPGGPTDYDETKERWITRAQQMIDILIERNTIKAVDTSGWSNSEKAIYLRNEFGCIWNIHKDDRQYSHLPKYEF